MASHYPASSISTSTSSIEEQPRQTNDQLMVVVTEQLQAQLHGDRPLPDEARKLLEKPSTVLAAPLCTEESGVVLNNLQTPMGAAYTESSKKRKVVDVTSWKPSNVRPSKRRCRTSPLSIKLSKVMNQHVERLAERFSRLQLEPEDEQKYLQEASRIRLPAPDRTETTVLLYGVPGPVPNFDDDDDKSSSESVVSSLMSSPEVRPSTPETNASSCASPSALTNCIKSPADADVGDISDRVTGLASNHEEGSEDGAPALSGSPNDVATTAPQQDEALESEPTKDEKMSDANEDVLDSSAHDGAMDDTAEYLPAGSSEDVTMPCTTEHLQPGLANGVHMAFSHEDESEASLISEEPSQDSAMQDVLTPQIGEQDQDEQPAPQPFVTEPEQDTAEMEGVQLSASIPSPSKVQSTTTPQHSTAAPTFSSWNTPNPSTVSSEAAIVDKTSRAIEQTEEIWHDLAALGPDFHTDLQKELDDSVVEKVPDLHQAVEKHIRTTKTSAGLINLLKLHQNAGRLSLPQTKALKECVVQARAREAAAPDDDMQDVSPAAPFKEPLMPPPELPREQRRETPAFVTDAPQLHYLAARKSTQASPHVSDAAYPLTKEVLTLIQQATLTIDEQPKLVRRFGSMFVLPWHDDAEMQRIVQCITKYKSLETLRGYAAQDLLYDCRKFSQAKGSSLKKTKPVMSYDARRPDFAAKIFNFIAVSNYRLMKDQNYDDCLTWQGIQELVEREEGAFFQPTKKLAGLSNLHYNAYIDERLAHWKDPQNLRNYIAQLNGDAQLTVGKLVLAPSTAIKRGGGDLDLDEDGNANKASLAQPHQVKRRQLSPVSRLDRANAS